MREQLAEKLLTIIAYTEEHKGEFFQKPIQQILEGDKNVPAGGVLLGLAAECLLEQDPVYDHAAIMNVLRIGVSKFTLKSNEELLAAVHEVRDNADSFSQKLDRHVDAVVHEIPGYDPGRLILDMAADTLLGQKYTPEQSVLVLASGSRQIQNLQMAY